MGEQKRRRKKAMEQRTEGMAKHFTGQITDRLIRPPSQSDADNMTAAIPETIEAIKEIIARRWPTTDIEAPEPHMLTPSIIGGVILSLCFEDKYRASPEQPMELGGMLIPQVVLEMMLRSGLITIGTTEPEEGTRFTEVDVVHVHVPAGSLDDGGVGLDLGDEPNENQEEDQTNVQSAQENIPPTKLQ